MSKPAIKELLVYKKDLLLKSSTHDHLEEHEYLFTHIIYNSRQQVVSEVHYDANGVIVQDYQFTYDDNGFLTGEILKEDDGFVAEHKTFEADEKGNIAREFRHYMDGSFDTINYSYNDQGLVSRKEVIDPDGETESVEEYEYTDGLLTRHAILDADGDIVNEKKIVYNSLKKPAEVIDFDGNEGITIKRVMEYYPSGNQKESYTYQDDELVEKVVTKEDENGNLILAEEETHHKKNTVNFAYDQQGNVVLQEEYDRDGNLITRISRAFDQENRLLSADVFMDGGGRGLSKNYSLRQKYVI
jgi:antitoxin component YwqK of YwqJK toxin-antitoxin module